MYDLPGRLLAKTGDATNRKLNRRIVASQQKFNPVATKRNLIMAHKIRALAEKTGHKNIGIFVGSGHVGMSDILQDNKPLTPEALAEIAKRGPDALKMFRCAYDKKEGKWKVEEHSL